MRPVAFINLDAETPISLRLFSVFPEKIAKYLELLHPKYPPNIRKKSDDKLSKVNCLTFFASQASEVFLSDDTHFVLFFNPSSARFPAVLFQRAQGQCPPALGIGP